MPLCLQKFLERAVTLKYCPTATDALTKAFGKTKHIIRHTTGLTR
jgi:hypothetical protein